MQNFSDDQFSRFKMQSDNAFREMEARADSNMAEFLGKYGGSISLTPKTASQTAGANFFHQALERQGQAAAAIADPVFAALSKVDVPKLDDIEAVAGIDRAQMTDAVLDLQDDFRMFSEGLQRDTRSMAKDAVRGTKDILSREAFDLGQKAKQEATALREAAKAAMEEERTLKGLRGRASEEMRKVRERLSSHLEETKEQVLDDLQQMATGKLDSLKDRARDLLESGQDSVGREWNDLKTGRDS